MTPANRPDLKVRIEALVDYILGDRVDRHLLRPTLLVALSVEVNDFIRQHPVEFAANRVKDHEILLRHARYRQQQAKASA